MHQYRINQTLNRLLQEAQSHEARLTTYLKSYWSYWYSLQFYFFPATKFQLLKEYFEANLHKLEQLVHIASEHRLNARQADFIALFIGAGFPDPYLYEITHVMHQYPIDHPLYLEGLQYFEGLIEKLSDFLKKILKKSPQSKSDKTRYTNLIKFIQGTIYSKLIKCYLNNNQLDLLVLAAQKALEGYEVMPNHLSASGHNTINPYQTLRKGRKEDIIRFQKDVINGSLLLYSIYQADYSAAHLHLQNILASKHCSDPFFDAPFRRVFPTLIEQHQHQTIIQLSGDLLNYYTHFQYDEFLSGGNLIDLSNFFELKKQYYRQLHLGHKEQYLEGYRLTLMNLNSLAYLTVSITPEFDIQLAFKDTVTLKQLSLPKRRFSVSLQQINDHTYQLINWYELSPDTLKSYVLDLNIARGNAIAKQTLSHQSGAGVGATTTDPFEFDEMRQGLSQIDLLNQRKLPKRRRQHQNQPQPEDPVPAPLGDQRQLIHQLNAQLMHNETKTAGEIGFKNIDPETILYGISNEYLPKGQYYVYDTQMPRVKLNSALREQCKTLLESGEVVGPGKPGIRILTANERKKHDGCIMKIAIPHQNDRVGIKEVETLESADGKTIRLCRPWNQWKH